MIAGDAIALAHDDDAVAIALMSRDLIESGLSWAWTPPRIRRMVRDRDVNVAVARSSGVLGGFGIMAYKDDEAHLLLLAVDPVCRRAGLGSALVHWLENCATTAGIGTVYVEARAGNVGARAFYRALGYQEISHVARMYPGEDGVRLAKDLWR